LLPIAILSATLPLEMRFWWAAARPSAAYVLKAPKKAYRLFKRRSITADGEVISAFKQKKLISALAND
jgi:hypothetical protein